MIDLSDGLSSGPGPHLPGLGGRGPTRGLGHPGGAGAAVDDALAGGDDYELCFTAPDPVRVAEAFAAAGLYLPAPIGAGDRRRRGPPGNGRRRHLARWPPAAGSTRSGDGAGIDARPHGRRRPAW